MSLFDKQKKIEKLAKDKYNVDEFIQLINIDYRQHTIFAKFNLFVSEKFGLEFKQLWNGLEENEIEKIELIFYLMTMATNQDREVFEFFNQTQTKSFLNKTGFYIEKSPFEIIEVKENNLTFYKIIKKEVGEILKKINDPNLNIQVHNIFNNEDHKEIEKELFGIQKPFYDKFKKIQKNPPKHSSINFDILNRKIQAFVRHEKEHSDKVMKEFYEKLDNKSKVKELRRLTIEFLVAIYILKEQN